MPFAMDIFGGGIAGFTRVGRFWVRRPRSSPIRRPFDPTHPSSYDLRESAKDDISNHNLQVGQRNRGFGMRHAGSHVAAFARTRADTGDWGLGMRHAGSPWSVVRGPWSEGATPPGPPFVRGGRRARACDRSGESPRARRIRRLAARRGFTLIELLVVILIILLVSAVALPVVLPAMSHRQVSEAARILQGSLVGAQNSALHNASPAGIRLLPDPAFPLLYTTINGVTQIDPTPAAGCQPHHPDRSGA